MPGASPDHDCQRKARLQHPAVLASASFARKNTIIIRDVQTLSHFFSKKVQFIVLFVYFPVKKAYPERRYLRFKDGQTWYWVYFKTAKEYRAAAKYYYEREEARNGPRAVNYNPQEKEKLDKDTAALLRCVQADINKIKFQAESEINEATDGIKKISERLNS